MVQRAPTEGLYAPEPKREVSNEPCPYKISFLRRGVCRRWHFISDGTDTQTGQRPHHNHAAGGPGWQQFQPSTFSGCTLAKRCNSAER